MENLKESLIENVGLFGEIFVESLKNMLGVNFLMYGKPRIEEEFIHDPGLVISINFIGNIQGEYIISLDEITAANLCHFENRNNSPDEHKRINREISDICKEILNITVGSAIQNLEKEHKYITYQPAIAIFGEVEYPRIPLGVVELIGVAGKIKCCFMLNARTLNVGIKLDNAIVQKNIINTYAKKLTEAKERVEASNKLKSAFLANLSHEIRTPLSGIIGMISFLLQTELTKQQREYAEIAFNSSEILLDIINDILDSTKLEARKLNLENIFFDLRTTLDTILDMMALKAQAKGIEIVCLIDPVVPYLLCGDSYRLRQILINLIGNAIKFTSQGEVIITITVDSETQSGVLLKFQISDTGIGIPEEKMELLFEPFVQADNATSRKYGGTGLGLSIVKKLVEMMHGKISVKSISGKGSEFSFTAEFAKQTDMELKTWKPPADFSKYRILVVSSNTAIRSLMKNFLDAIHCYHEEVKDTETAFIKMIGIDGKQQLFDVIIIDMVIPKTSLIELGNRIKGFIAFSNVKMIMMTPMNVQYEDTLFDAINLSAYLTKPIKAAKLYQCLIDIL